jgi:hypothetical protein
MNTRNFKWKIDQETRRMKRTENEENEERRSELEKEGGRDLPGVAGAEA